MQNHDLKLTETLSTITAKLDEIDNSTEKPGDKNIKSNSENEKLQLAIQNTQNYSHPGVLYDTSLENKLTNLKTAKNFFKIAERPNGDIFRNRISIENLAD